MSRRRPTYPKEFRERMIEMVRWGHSPEGLAPEFEPTPGTILLWLKQAERDEGRRSGLTTAEQEELSRLRRENKQLKLEREILSKAAGRVAPGDAIVPP